MKRGKVIMNDKQAHSLAVAMTKAIMGKDYISTDDNKEKKLLPCPFCGSEATLNKPEFLYSRAYIPYCTNNLCGCALDAGYPSKKDAIDAWNNRKLRGSNDR